MNCGLIEKLPAKSENHRQTIRFILAVISPALCKSEVLSKFKISECDWINIFAVADRGLVAPLLYSCICDKQMENVCPEDFIQALKAYSGANQKRNAIHRDILIEAASHLNKVGIKPTLLKGAHALVGLLPHSESRIISDIDLLIPEERLEEALEVLLGLGYYHDADANHSHSLDSHHVDPLFHPSGEGYLELHRRPNFSDRYSPLISNCFDSSSLELKTIDGADFYVLFPWQLLLYNQVHHFHSFLSDDASIYEHPDMRYLSEQAGLLVQLGNPQKLVEVSRLVFKDKLNVSLQQFFLLRELFDIKLPDGLVSDNKNIRDEATYTIERLLQSRGSKWRHRRRYLAKLVNRTIDLNWCKERLLSLEWYKSRPQAFRLHLKNLR